MIKRIADLFLQNLSLGAILGSFGFMIFLCTIGGAGLYFLPPLTPEAVVASPIVQVIEGFTSTPHIPTQTPTIAPTATENLPPSPLPNMIGIGSTVQIFGTDGEGLNIRLDPGLTSDIVFLAYDSEVFEIGEGPQVIDNITWWYLFTPIDSSRGGWAASNYLSLITNP